MADPVRTLAKHLNVFFASPVLNAKLDKVIDRSRGQIENVKTRDGKEIISTSTEIWSATNGKAPI